nr:MAG TPA: hypothetical protein [Bacteriophage sp.]
MSKYGNNRVLSSVYNGRSAADSLPYYIMQEGGRFID